MSALEQTVGAPAIEVMPNGVSGEPSGDYVQIHRRGRGGDHRSKLRSIGQSSGYSDTSSLSSRCCGTRAINATGRREKNSWHLSRMDRMGWRRHGVRSPGDGGSEHSPYRRSRGQPIPNQRIVRG